MRGGVLFSLTLVWWESLLFGGLTILFWYGYSIFATASLPTEDWPGDEGDLA